MSTATIRGWSLQVERGPDWLFIRLQPEAGSEQKEVDLAEALWDTLEQHMTHRLVLDMSDVNVLYSWFIGQLVNLHKRISTHDGMLRLCNLSAGNQEAIRICQLQNQLPSYDDRHSAVMGQRVKPR